MTDQYLMEFKELRKVGLRQPQAREREVISARAYTDG